MKKILLSLIITLSFANAAAQKEFYENGALKYEVIYTAKSNLNCLVKTFFKNGNIKYESLHTTDSRQSCISSINIK